jgi:hypothetical protein
MKRKNNGLIVGTILVVLIGALIFLQAMNQEPSEDEHGHTDAPPPAPGAPAPRVDEHLDNPGTAAPRGPTIAPQ